MDFKFWFDLLGWLAIVWFVVDCLIDVKRWVQAKATLELARAAEIFAGLGHHEPAKQVMRRFT